MLIIPAILEKNFSSAKEKIKALSPFFNRFQIDIADNIFVPNKTLETKDFKFNKFQRLKFDFHLMVKNPEKELKVLNNKENVKIVFINLESFTPKILTQNYTFEVGITLNPKDKLEEFAQKPFFKKIQHLLVMTVNPGFQGSKFLPETLLKIKNLKELGFRGKIYLDGGINEKTIRYIKPYKDSIYALCIGSYLTKAKDVKKAKEVLNKSLNIDQV